MDWSSLVETWLRKKHDSSCTIMLAASIVMAVSGCRSPAPKGEPRSEARPAPVVSWGTAGEGEFASVLGRLHASGPDRNPQVRAIWVRLEAWQKTQAAGTHSSARDFAEISDAIQKVAADQREDAHVVISTRPNSKATIKYQTFGQRQRGEPPSTAKGPAPCTETMVIGWYYLWSERHGQKTSPDDRLYRIAGREVSIELEEAQ